MPMLNARCMTCGTVFPSGYVLENVTDATLAGNTAGPCPRCGGRGLLIANNVTVDIGGDRITVKRGYLPPEDIALAVSTLTRFQEAQDNREEAEQQIGRLAPQLKPIVPGLPTDKLMMVIAMLLALVATWQRSPEAQEMASQQIQQIVTILRQEAAEDIVTAFVLYQEGKQSVHGLRNKIVKFFPATESELRSVGLQVLMTLAQVAIPALLAQWAAAGQVRSRLSEFKATQEQNEAILAELRRIREAIEGTNPKE